MAHIPHPRSPHWVALVRSPQDRQWYLVDSIACMTGQAPVVRRMGTADWDRAAQRWNLNVLAHVNAAGLIVGGGRAGNTATPSFGWRARPTAEIRDMIMPEGEQRDACADMAAFVAANGIRPAQPRQTRPGTQRLDMTTGNQIWETVGPRLGQPRLGHPTPQSRRTPWRSTQPRQGPPLRPPPQLSQWTRRRSRCTCALDTNRTFSTHPSWPSPGVRK
jgi:hypothetical protein